MVVCLDYIVINSSTLEDHLVHLEKLFDIRR